MDLEAVSGAVNDLHSMQAAIEQAPSDAERARRIREAASRADQVLLKLFEDWGIDPDLLAARRFAEKYRQAVADIVGDDFRLEVFFQAEQGLLELHGVSGSASRFLIMEARELRRDVPAALERDPFGSRNSVEALRGEVAKVERQGDARGQRGTPKWLKRTLYIAGGCTMMGVNGLVGGGLTPVTGGVSLAGAAVSVGFGGALIGKGL
jgi:hypothetical protein